MFVMGENYGLPKERTTPVKWLADHGYQIHNVKDSETECCSGVTLSYILYINIELRKINDNVVNNNAHIEYRRDDWI